MTAVTLRKAPPQVEPKPEEKPQHVPRHAKARTPRRPFLQKVRNVSIRIPDPVNAVWDWLSARVVAPIRRRPIVAWAVGCLAVSVAVSPWLPMFWLPVSAVLITALGVWAACSYRIQEIAAERDKALKAAGALRQENNELEKRLASDVVLTQMLPQIRGGEDL